MLNDLVSDYMSYMSVERRRRWCFRFHDGNLARATIRTGGSNMPLTQLDDHSALIVIDLQKGIVSQPTAQPASEIVERAARLARAFRERGLPVVLVHVTGRAPGRTDAGMRQFPAEADWAELLAELGQQPGDFIVTKQRPGAFVGTPLDDYLRQRGVTQIVLAGISTSIGVESTAAKSPTISATTSRLSSMP